MSSDLRLAKKVDFAGKVNFPTLLKKLLPDNYGSLSHISNNTDYDHRMKNIRYEYFSKMYNRGR